MYFLRLKPLKRDLAARAISEKEVLPYLLWLGGLTIVGSMVPYGEDWNRWDVVSAVAGVGVFVLGTLLAYRWNGGASGDDFLIRYLCLNWVVGLRLVLAVLVPVMIAVIYAEGYFLGEVPEDSTGVEVLAGVVFEVLLYWRIAANIRAVSFDSRAA